MTRARDRPLARELSRWGWSCQPCLTIALFPGPGCQLVASARRPVDHGHGNPRNTHELIPLVPDFDAPHMTAFANVERACCCGHDSRRYGTEMVCINLLSQTDVFFPVHTERGCDAASGLGERD